MRRASTIFHFLPNWHTRAPSLFAPPLDATYQYHHHHHHQDHHRHHRHDHHQRWHLFLPPSYLPGCSLPMLHQFFTIFFCLVTLKQMCCVVCHSFYRAMLCAVRNVPWRCLLQNCERVIHISQRRKRSQKRRMLRSQWWWLLAKRLVLLLLLLHGVTWSRFQLIW